MDVFLAIFVFLSLNWGCIGLMYLLQFPYFLEEETLKRGAIIPKTKQRFLHMQDYHYIVSGDFIALPLIQVAFAFMLEDMEPAYWFWPWQWFLFTVIAVAGIVVCAINGMAEEHLPNWRCVRHGDILSKAGFVHAVYHGVNIAIAVTMIYFLCDPDVETGFGLYLLTFLGGGIYLFTLWLDARDKKFEPFKEEKEGEVAAPVPPVPPEEEEDP